MGGEGDGLLRFALTMPHNCHAAIWPGPGRHLVLYNLRFTLTEPHRCHAARGPAAADSRKAVNAAAGRGGSQVGRGGESSDGEGGRGVKGVYFKFSYHSKV